VADSSSRAAVYILKVRSHHHGQRLISSCKDVSCRPDRIVCWFSYVMSSWQNSCESSWQSSCESSWQSSCESFLLSDPDATINQPGSS
jgi:hypothetical protein